MSDKIIGEPVRRTYYYCLEAVGTVNGPIYSPLGEIYVKNEEVVLSYYRDYGY